MHRLHSYAIFCDDIRQEANGKTMFIGAYRDFMYFNGPGPWTLASFYVHSVFRHPLSEIYSAIQFQIRLTSQFSSRVVYQVDNPPFDNLSTAHGSRVDWDVEPYRQTRFSVALSQLVVEGDSRLSVHAFLNGREVMFDRLRMLQAPPPPPPPSSSTGLAALYAPPPR